jgi:hypothetical protein
VGLNVRRVAKNKSEKKVNQLSARRSDEYREIMRRLKHVRPGRSFTRDELNER